MNHLAVYLQSAIFLCVNGKGTLQQMVFEYSPLEQTYSQFTCWIRVAVRKTALCNSLIAFSGMSHSQVCKVHIYA